MVIIRNQRPMFSVHKFLYGNVESYALFIPAGNGQTCHIIRGDDPDGIVQLHNAIVRAIDRGIFATFIGCTFGEIVTAANARLIELAIRSYDKAIDSDGLIDILSALPTGRIS